MELITNSQENKTGNLYVPPASFTPTYDLDGNLTDDGEWTYLWDAENRMKAATRAARAVTAGAPYRRYEHTYDAMSRLVQTKTFATADTTVLKTEQYIYNGWNRVAMLESAGTATPALRQSYAWGLDISAQNGNSGQDSGGVGALLVVTDTQLGNHCPCYDSNGNIIAMVNAATKAISAQYGYSPFGETTRATGPFAEANPYRFSTKPTDSDTGLIYYGYRFYKPNWKTWPSRDPIGEIGGVNLYGFVYNSPQNYIDSNGELPILVVIPLYMLGAAALDLTFQWIVHIDSDEERFEIDVTSIVISGALGAVPGVGNIAGRAGSAIRHQAKAIEIGEKIMRRAPNNARRIANLKNRLNAEMVKEANAWAGARLGAGLVALKFAVDKAANFVADEVEKEFQGDCPEQLNGDIKIDSSPVEVLPPPTFNLYAPTFNGPPLTK